YWPATYLIDAEGRFRHHQFGEGEYAQTEMVIQRLLATAGFDIGPRDLVSVETRGVEAPADWGHLWSPENYLGYARTENFVSARVDHTYSAPSRLALSQWALSGDWTERSDAVVLNAAEGRLADRFHARDLHLVMARPPRGRLSRFAFSSM